MKVDETAVDHDGYERSTSSRVIHPERGRGPRHMRRHRIAYALGAVVLTLVMVVAVTDTLDVTAITGDSTDTKSARTGDYEMTIRYPTVTRPGLATPFDIVVRRDGGFDEPVRIAVSWDWLEMWDENSWYPNPSTSYGERGHLVMEFDPPSGDELRVIYDARIQPAQQSGSDGYVLLLDDADVKLVELRFHTRVLP